MQSRSLHVLVHNLACSLQSLGAMAQTHGHEIELPALIAGIVEQFLAGDQFFQRRRRRCDDPPALSDSEPDGSGS